MIQDRIIKTEERLLTGSDRTALVVKRNKQVAFLASAYIPMVLILVYVYLSGPATLYRDDLINSKHEVTEDDTKIFNEVVPYTCGFFFLMLTGYFIYQYNQAAVPLIKDLRMNKKKLLYTRVEKTEMAFFNRYYISTPIRKKQLVQVNKDDFYKIAADNSLVIEIAPVSRTILRMTNNEEPIAFF